MAATAPWSDRASQHLWQEGWFQVDVAVEGSPPDNDDAEAPLRLDLKKLLLLLVVGVGIALLLLRLTGEREALAMLTSAQVSFVLLAVAAEGLRYLAVALYTQKLLHFLGHHIRLWPFVELMFAGGSVNRIIAAGGAAGIYVRYRFFDKHGLSLGSLAVVLILQNLMTGVILFASLCLALTYLLSRQLMGATQLRLVAAMLGLMLGLFFLAVGLYRRPLLLRRTLDVTARLIDVPVRKIARRSVYNPAGLTESIDNFCEAIEVARRKPLETCKALAYGVVTLFSDIASLYFVFYALGFPIKLDVLIVGYIITNYIISILLMPEGIGVTEASLTAVYASLGIPSSIVVVATLLFRFIAFWLPIGVGLGALWDLRRKGLL
jgi:uncharacterized protein (TIRG00374 family)